MFTKQLVQFFLALGCLLLLSYSAFYTISVQKVILDDFFNQRFVTYEAVSTALEDILAINSDFQSMIFASSRGESIDWETTRADINAKVDRNLEALTKIAESGMLSEDEKPYIDTLVSNFDGYRNSLLTGLQMSGNLSMLMTFKANADRASTEMRQAVTELKKLQRQKVEESKEVARQNVESVTTTFLVVLTLATLILFTFSMLMARSITTPIRELMVVARAFSEGDFRQSTTIESKDEIGALASSFRSIQASMADLLLQIGSSMERINELNTSLTDNIDETASSLHEMNQTTAAVKDNMVGLDTKIDEVKAHSDKIEVFIAQELRQLIEDQSQAIERATGPVETINHSVGKIASLTQDRI